MNDGDASLESRELEIRELLAELETQNLRSQIAKNKAEVDKSEADALRIQQRYESWWLRMLDDHTPLIKLAIGLLVAGGIFALTFVGFYDPIIKPILQKENDVLFLNLEIEERQNRMERLQIEDELAAQNQQRGFLEAENEKLLANIKTLQMNLKGQQDQASELQIAQEEFSKERRAQSEQATSSEDSERLLAASLQAADRADKLSAQIKIFKSLEEDTKGLENELCYERFFRQLKINRVATLEVGSKDVDIIGIFQPKDEPIAIRLENLRRPIGGIRFSFFPNSGDIFKIDRIIDSKCQEIEGHKNISRGGDKNVLQNWDTLRIPFEGIDYLLRLGGGDTIEVNQFILAP